MSDPVTNVEIEDVLSSIRRLVSVDPDRKPRKPPAGEDATHGSGNGDAGAASGEDKLVLTSDLRVKGDAEGDGGAVRHDTEALKRRIAELEAAVNAQADDFEPDGSEDTEQHRPKSIPTLSFRTQAEAAERTGRLAPIAADGVMDIGAFVQREVDEVMSSLPAQAQERGDATGDEDAGPENWSACDAGHPEDDGGDGDRDGSAPAHADGATWEIPTENVGPEAEAETVQDADPTPSDDDLMEHLLGAQGEDALEADRAAHAAEDAAEAEAAQIPQDEPFSKDDTQAAQGAEPEILEAEQHRIHPFNNGGMDRDLREAPERGIDLAEDAVLDEEALREMVADIVREELQGALGERITRNVRKLVRREIMRAISIRDFE